MQKDKDTKEIYNFIKQIQKQKNQTQKKYNEKRTSPKFSKESRVFIEKIFHYMKQGSLQTKKMSTISLEQLPTGNHFHLLDQEIKTEIENQIKIYKKTTFQIGDREFDIYMCFPNAPLDMSTMDTWLHYMYVWFYVAAQFAVPSCSRHLSVYVYYTNLKKNIPDIDGALLEADNANTAFTFACNMPNAAVESKNEIYIYRLEEWFKVFLHETFHSFGMDFAAMDQTEPQNRICDSGNIYHIPCTDLRFYESYTETWAEIVQCMFAVHFNETAIDKQYKEQFQHENIDSVGKLEEFVYGYEATFSAFQAAKVLDHFGLTYEDLFNKGAASKYKETTPVFAYYIIKSVFMNHADEFIRWTMEQNRGSLQFKKTQTNMNKLVDLLQTLCKNAEYMQLMDEMDETVERTANHLLASTMRMSCISFL
jgi:hypothetical protein